MAGDDETTMIQQPQIVPPTIYLQPMCDWCRRALEGCDTGRMWCADDVGPCEECGAPWIAYTPAGRAALEAGR